MAPAIVASPETPSQAAPSPVSGKPLSQRLVSVDAYRGLVMLLMMAEVMKLKDVSEQVAASEQLSAWSKSFWAFLAHHQSHALWLGCSLHDLIQPSFSFLVGVALPFSLAGRSARGQTTTAMVLHAFGRAAILILLGIFLRSVGKTQTSFQFDDTLTQIGLGYGFLFLLGLRSRRDQWVALALLLIGYWAIFALYPLPGADFDYASVNVSSDWLREHGLSGFARHWNKNSNAAWAFDTWFMNLFPRSEPFKFNSGGYATLSFIPTLGTMILGLLAGGVLRSDSSDRRKLQWLVAVGTGALLAGWLAGAIGICPVVKRIWSPSWTLFSGGWCCLLMALFYVVTDVKKFRAWAFPLIVVGMNSIAAYAMAHFMVGYASEALTTHLGRRAFLIAGEPFELFLRGAAVLVIEWLILWYMYRNKIIVRI